MPCSLWKCFYFIFQYFLDGDERNGSKRKERREKGKKKNLDRKWIEKEKTPDFFFFKITFYTGTEQWGYHHSKLILVKWLQRWQQHKIYQCLKVPFLGNQDGHHPKVIIKGLCLLFKCSHHPFVFQTQPPDWLNDEISMSDDEFLCAKLNLIRRTLRRTGKYKDSQTHP